MTAPPLIWWADPLVRAWTLGIPWTGGGVAHVCAEVAPAHTRPGWYWWQTPTDEGLAPSLQDAQRDAEAAALRPLHSWQFDPVTGVTRCTSCGVVLDRPTPDADRLLRGVFPD